MNEQREVNIMLGGKFPTEVPTIGVWCGVDKGALYLADKGIRPLLSCGDFDSISESDRKKIESISENFKIKESQDLTDADYALEELVRLYSSVEKINIYGATGKRLDHFFGNIFLLNNEKYGRIELSIIDDNNIITIAKKGENIFSAKKGYKYFSIIPIFQDTKMTIKNSKYEAENLLLTLDRPNATSNEFCENKDIKLEVSKNVLVIYSKD